MATATGEPQHVSSDRAVMVWVRLGAITAAALAILALAAFALSPRRLAGGGAPIKATGASMRTLVTSIKGYNADKGVYPPNLEALVSEKYLEKVYQDSWKRGFIYSLPGPAGRDFGLVSTGPDGIHGTADDVDWWRVDEE